MKMRSHVLSSQARLKTRLRVKIAYQYKTFNVGAANAASLGALMSLCGECSCELTKSSTVNNNNPTQRARNDVRTMSAMMFIDKLKSWIGNFLTKIE